jgi:phosphatidylglycerol:prolipoprotein diacylglycerol transferase
MKPILFTINLGFIKIPIHSYGVMLALSFFIGTIIAARYAERKEGISEDDYISATMITMIGILIGSRIFFIVEHWEDYRRNILEIFAIWKGGLVLYGGLFGGIITGIIVAWRKKIPVGKYFDAGAPSIALGVFLTRIGCFLNGCCYGKPTDSPFGISFPEGSYAYIKHLREGLISPKSDFSLPVHPTELYESFGGIVIFGIMLLLRKRKKIYDGEYMIQFLILYSILRLIVEFFRGDHPAWFLSTFTTPQVISIFIFIVCSFYEIFRIIKK